MKRFTTDDPETNTEAILNFAYAADGEVKLRYADGAEGVSLAEYIAGLAHENGCTITAKDVMEGSCMECDCAVAVLNATAIQAAELRARLKAYEDSGFSPADFQALKGITPERVKEIAGAENAGRLIITPCKVGDTVYVAGKGRVVTCHIDEAYMNDTKWLEYIVSFNCEEGSGGCEGCPFNSWYQDWSGEYSCDGEWGHGAIQATSFGKTVFTSLAEAERAATAAMEGSASNAQTSG